MKRRLSKVRSTLTSLGLDGFLVTFLPHIRYLTGFTGSNGLLFCRHGQWFFITDARYHAQSRSEVRECKVVISRHGGIEEIRLRKLFNGVRTLGIDERSLSLNTFRTIRTYSSDLQFRAVNDLVETLAVQKDRTEIDRIRKAVKISDRVFADILPLIKSGVRECDIAAEIVYRMRLQGAESESFEPVVASGVRSAMPHARASAKKIRNGEFVLIDFGSKYMGYHSDMTHTIHLGKPSVRERRLYRAVSDARERAIEKITAGIPANAIDRIARKSLGNDRLTKYFIHPAGHGIGLQVHDYHRQIHMFWLRGMSSRSNLGCTFPENVASGSRTTSSSRRMTAV
jgi:Xaa-Pro aminopeptidase